MDIMVIFVPVSFLEVLDIFLPCTDDIQLLATLVCLTVFHLDFPPFELLILEVIWAFT